jgi:hypothetical protein
MGWDKERYPRTKKDTFEMSFIHFAISDSRFSDYRIPFFGLGYPIMIPMQLDNGGADQGTGGSKDPSREARAGHS